MSCCEQWKEQAETARIPAGGAFLYPGPMPQHQIERTSSGYNVYGCCGGGCYVLTDIKFCPWCGTPLDKEA